MFIYNYTCSLLLQAKHRTPRAVCYVPREHAYNCVVLRIHRAMLVCVSIIMQYVTYTQSYACMCVNYNAVCYVYTELCLYVCQL